MTTPTPVLAPCKDVASTPIRTIGESRRRTALDRDRRQPIARTPSTSSASPERSHDLPPRLPGAPLGAARTRRARLLGGPRRPAPRPPGGPARPPRDHHDRPHRRGGRLPSGAGPAGDGFSASVGVDEGTQMVALSWAGGGAPYGELRIRSRGTDGTWTAWQDLEATEGLDEGPDAGAPEQGNGRHGVGPIWLGTEGAEQVDVRVHGGSFPDLSMEAMRWIDPVTPAGAAAGAEPSGPGIIGRDAWAPGGWRGRQPRLPRPADLRRPAPLRRGAPHRQRQRLLAVTDRRAPRRHLPVPHRLPRLVRHRLQLLRRPLRSHLAGPERRPRRAHHRRALEGLQHRQRGRRVPRAVPAGCLAGGRQPDPGRARRALRAAGVEVQHPRREPPGKGDRRERREHEVRRGRLGDDPPRSSGTRA